MGPLGLFGGMFNPIHFGHLRAAWEVKQGCKLEKIRFIPCGAPPHRAKPTVIGYDRNRMVEIAIGHHPEFEVDDCELRREGPSYTVDTLKTIRNEVGTQRPLCLIMGMDAYLSLPTWHQWQQIATLSHIIVAHRPGCERPQTGLMADFLAEHQITHADQLNDKSYGSVLLHEITPLAISSTKIREAFSHGLSPQFLVPDSVLQYIREKKLYDEFI